MDRQDKLLLLDQLESKAEKVFFDDLRKGALVCEPPLVSPPLGLQLAQYSTMLSIPMTLDLRPNALRHPPQHIKDLSQHCLDNGCTDEEVQAALAVAWDNACTRYRYYFEGG